MIRKNLNEHSAHGLINIFPTGISEFGYRLQNGGTMIADRGPEVSWENVQLKIEKARNTVRFFILNDGTWEELGKLNIAKWGNSFYVGIATLSHDNSQLTKAQYSKINLTN